MISDETMLLARQTRAKLAPLVAELIRNYTTEAQAGVLGRVFLNADRRSDDTVQKMNVVIAEAIVAGRAADPSARIETVRDADRFYGEPVARFEAMADSKEEAPIDSVHFRMWCRIAARELKFHAQKAAQLQGRLEATWGIIDALRAEEGNSVTLVCDNPDFNGQPNAKVICCGEWTDFNDLEFAGENVEAALKAAYTAMVAAKEPCPECNGGGWIAYATGQNDPHFKECGRCHNPTGRRSP